MADTQRLIDEIRFRLQSQDWELTDEVRGIAEEYAGLCREANTRLRRCGEFLKQGLRSEAVHLADSQPRLLDLLASIDFPERAEWDEMVAFYQLPKPDPLLLDVAEQLNEAYALQQPLERLLDRHRLLALQRAPLSQRLAVLRKIAESDSSSPVWEDDVRTFEKARLAEVEYAMQGAFDRADAQGLAAIAAELAQPGWRETPSKALLQRAKRLSDDVGRRSARAELDLLEPQLNVAFGELNAAKGRGLRDKWNSLATRARLAAGDSLLERVAPALGWLADEDARAEGEKSFQSAIATLEQILDRQTADIEEIRRAGHAVLKCERGMPDLLKSRYEQRLRAFELVAHRRHRMLIGGIALSVGLVVGIIGLVMHRSSVAANVKHVTDSCQQLIAAGNLEEARDLLTQHADLSTWPEWLETQTRLNAAELEEGARTTRLQELLNGAESAANAAEAQSGLKEARELARTTDEKLAILELEDRWHKSEATAREARERQFQELLSALADKLKELESLHKAKDYGDDFLSLALAIERGLKELKLLNKSIAAGLVTQLNVLESRIDGIRKVTNALQRKGAILEEITKLASFHPGTNDAEQKLQRYSELAKELAKDHPDDPRAADFGIVAKEIPELRGVVAWQRSSSAWRQVDPQNIETAKRWLADCRAWLERHFHSPDAHVARDYADFLRSFVAREESTGDGEEEGVRQALLQLFSGPLIDGVQYIEMKDGRMYYMLAEQKFDKSSIARFDHIAGFNGETKKKSVMLSDLVADHTRLAAQSEIAKGVRGDLPTVSLARWDSYLGKLAWQVETHPKLDHLLKHFLLVKTLDHAGSANSLLKIELKPILLKLTNEKIDLAAKWMDPDDAQSKVARQRAKDTLGLLQKDELAESWSRADRRFEFLKAQVRRHVQPIGWLSQNADGTWAVRTSWSPGPEQKRQLLVATPVSVESVLGWTPVGIAASPGGIKLDNNLPAGVLRSGRLVFAADVIDEMK